MITEGENRGEDNRAAEPGVGRSNIAHLVQVLAEAQDFHASALEIAEIFWLALHLKGSSPGDADPEPNPEPNPEPEPEPESETGIGEDLTPIEAGPEPEPADDSSVPSSRPLPKVPLMTRPPRAGVLPTQALPLWLADPPFLTNVGDIVRSLRPLCQKVESGRDRHLNELKTVETIARTGVWWPTMEPEREPWFEILLVIDRGSSMELWRRLGLDLRRILGGYGSFKTVQVLDLEIDPEAPLADRVCLRTHPGCPPRRPREFIDQQGRRIVIVLSDCAGCYWWDGTLLPMFQAWTKVMPTVIWQVLPPWMWERTALGRGTPVTLRNGSPGVANGGLEWAVRGREEQPKDGQQRVVVPVITSDIRNLHNWSLMLAGDYREVTPGFLLPSQGGTVPQSPSLESGRDSSALSEPELEELAQKLAQQRVERFRQLASPSARRLVMLLAAAPVITLPVMRLIREAMLPDLSSPLPVAEVFLSGLLQRLPDQEGMESEGVQYDFLAAVRSVLLGMLPAVDTIEVINRVSAAVEARWNRVSDQDFRAFLCNPQIEAPEGLEGLRAFARVTAAILEPLGGDYRDLVEQLRRGAGERGSELEPENEPAWESFEFDSVTLVRVDDPLEPFEFPIATLTPQGEVSYREGQAERFVEALPEGVALEMVSIPAGEFLMGSPDTELEHNSDEAPQHRVTVPSFAMGRYPVTQRQWRAVAALPQVEIALNLDPSQFKGEDRPVEQVNWHEAREFCERLSRHSQRLYRLPSEAEWEYACRAGTSTPFYVGETLSTAVANYNGNYTYGEGKKGEYRQSTTPVTQFQAYNKFGLGDMHGNVWEWCLDRWHGNYQGAPGDGSAWESGDSSSNVLRGGSWSYTPRHCRSAYRLDFTPDCRYLSFGFRVVCSPRGLP